VSPPPSTLLLPFPFYLFTSPPRLRSTFLSPISPFSLCLLLSLPGREITSLQNSGEKHGFLSCLRQVSCCCCCCCCFRFLFPALWPGVDNNMYAHVCYANLAVCRKAGRVEGPGAGPAKTQNLPCNAGTQARRAMFERMNSEPAK